MLPALTSLCKRRGFVFPGSEVYGGLSGSFDYGPLGTQLKLNLKSQWWRRFVEGQRDCVGLDSGILLSRRVWEASGHVDNFIDPLSECDTCKRRVRADHFLEEVTKQPSPKSLAGLKAACGELMRSHKWNCPHCRGPLREPKEFNLLFSTTVGPTATATAQSFLRPETAQGAYINLNNVASAARRTTLPFGIGQMGTVFRNEVSPRDFIFRTREFEQAELQWFCSPESSAKWHAHWVDTCMDFLTSVCGLKPQSVRVRHHDKEELAHYALATTDLEFLYPFGWGEMWGIANRGDHDLKAHAAASKTKFLQGLPCHVVEPSLGLNRLLLAILCDAYYVDSGTNRTVLRLKWDIAPIQVGVFPVVTNKPELVERAESVYRSLWSWGARVDIDTSSTSVGKKYRRQDEIGTPACIVVDDQTLQDGSVALRERDTMKQIRLSVHDYTHKDRFVDLYNATAGGVTPSG